MSESHIRSSQGEHATIYFAQAGENGMVKVGSATDVDRRVTHLRSKERQPLVLRRTMAGGVKWERVLHAALEPWRIRGEWYKPAPEVLALFDMSEAEIRAWSLEQKSAVADAKNRNMSRRAWKAARPIATLH